MDQFPPPPPPSVPALHESLLTPQLNEVPWRAREGILVALFGLLTGGFFSLLVATRFEKGDPTLQLLVVMLLEGSLGFWVWLWVKLRHGAGFRELGVRFHPSDVGAGVVAGLLGLGVASAISAIVLEIARSVTNKTVTTPQQLPTIHENPQWVLAFFAVVVVAPVAEELFFRGFMYQALRRWRGVTQGIVLSALIFALAHVSPLIIPPIFALGIILGYLFEKRRSLAATMAAHMSYNLIGFIAIVATSRH